MKTTFVSLALLMAAGPGLRGQSNVDPAHRFAWAGNLGWVDARAGDGLQGASLRNGCVSGYLWSAGAGWINLGDGTPANGTAYTNASADDFGVHRLADGRLRGLAWGANLGWIVFENGGNPRVDQATGALHGHAWMANAGWLNLDGLRITDAAALIADAAAASLEGLVSERSAVAITPEASGGIRLTFSGIPGHLGVLQAAEDLTPPVNWTDVAVLPADDDGVLSFVDPAVREAPRRFYRVLVR